MQFLMITWSWYWIYVGFCGQTRLSENDKASQIIWLALSFSDNLVKSILDLIVTSFEASVPNGKFDEPHQASIFIWWNKYNRYQYAHFDNDCIYFVEDHESVFCETNIHIHNPFRWWSISVDDEKRPIHFGHSVRSCIHYMSSGCWI